MLVFAYLLITAGIANATESSAESTFSPTHDPLQARSIIARLPPLQGVEQATHNIKLCS